MKRLFTFFILLWLGALGSAGAADKQSFDCPESGEWKSKIIRMNDAVYKVSTQHIKLKGTGFEYETPYYQVADGIYINAEMREKDLQKIRITDDGNTAEWRLEGSFSKCAREYDGANYICSEMCFDTPYGVEEDCEKIDAKIEPVGKYAFVMTPGLVGGKAGEAFYFFGENDNTYYSPLDVAAIRIDGDTAFFQDRECK